MISGRKEPDEDEHLFHVLITKAHVDPTSEHVYCPYCHALMKYLSGFPSGHAQWICTSCASMAYEGYGDTPSHNTDYRSLSSPNDPYTTDDNTSRPIIQDLPTDLDEPQDRSHYTKIDFSSVDKRRRYGMRYAFMSAEEATRQI